MTRQRLSGMDALAFHTETQKAPAHVLVVITLEPAEMLSHTRLQDVVVSSLPGLAKFRSRLVGKPFGLGQPVWAEAEEFDPADHVYRVAVAPPGGRGEFADLIAKLVTRPLDRDRPLWQVWTIEGLEGDRWGLVLKLAPAMIDGPEGLEPIVERLLTAEPDGRDDLPTEAGPGAPPSIVDLVAETASELAANQIAGLRLAGEALPEVLAAAAHWLRGGNGDGVPVSRTVFNEPLTPRREVAFGSVQAADVEAIKNAHQVGTDDVLLAACALSLRTWLLLRDCLPDHPLVIQVAMGPSVGRVQLPVHVDDPVEVLEELHAQTQQILIAHPSNGQKHSGAVTLPTIANLVPPNVIHAGMRLYAGLGLSRRLAPTMNGIAARVSGPAVPMYCARARVAGVHAVPALLEGAGLAVTWTSYADVLDLSVSVCPERVCDVERIADGIVGAVAALHRSGAGTES